MSPDDRQKPPAKDILAMAREVLAIEAEGITRLIDRLGPSFEQAVELMLASPKVITTGIGKSGIVARKIMATLNSTGTKSTFLHPVEALHGDLGTVDQDDVVLAISHSGETIELVQLIPQLRQHGARVVALTGGMRSALARSADLVVDCGVEREACPHGLAPTASTTAALAVGDALAVVLMERHRFRPEDFRRHHPGGHLGQRLALSVSQVMTRGDQVPLAAPADSVARAVEIIDQGDLGTVLIVEDGVLKGIFTDGDIRRMVLKGVLPDGAPVGEVMTADPLAIGPEASAADCLQIMEQRQITALPIVDHQRRVLGLVHLHDLLGRGTISFQTVCE